MKRLFIAVKIDFDPTFIHDFRRMKQALSQDKIKWVEEHNVHLTLKFLGETEERKIPAIEEALKHISRTSFRISLQGVGLFGSRYDPRVIWVGVEPYAEMVDLMKRVHESVVPVGFEPDRQNLVPHLTLGRIKEIRDKTHFQQVVHQSKSLKSAPIGVTEFILFESILKREGPEYRVLKKFPLQ